MVIQLYSYSFSPIGKEFHDILSGITGQSGRLKENHPRECVTARKAVPYCRILDQNCDNRRILLCFRFTLQSGLRRGQQHCRRSRAAVSARIPQRTSVHSHRAVPRCCSPDFSALWPSDRMQPIWPARSADCSSMLLQLLCSFCSAATSRECLISPHSCSAICCCMVTM